MQHLRLRLKGNRLFQLLLAVLGIIFPVIVANVFIFDNDGPNPYGFLWIGFYSCVLALLFCRRKWMSILILLGNIPGLLLLLFFSVMGGLQGLLAMTLWMIFPLFPLEWFQNFSQWVLPPERFPPV